VGIYIYAIGHSGDGALPALDGILGQPVFRLASGALGAIVSDCPLDAVRAERKHLAASQRVLSTLNQEFDLLPMAFGTVAQSAGALTDFLDEYAEMLTARLHDIAGTVEMSVRLQLDVPDAIAYLVQCTPELKIARDRLFGRHRPPSHGERIRLGQMCDAALRHYRDAQTAQMLTLLGPTCAEIRTLPVGLEKQIANLAMLVPRDAVERFEAAVNDLAAQLPDEFSFTMGGPWPPHNFVQLEL
jgi:Gas vesicle synthesis protein GvpL/GvpF